MMNKKTILIGATTKPERDAYSAAIQLMAAGNEVVLLGIREGEVNGNKIITGRPQLANVHTITLYLNSTNQKQWYDYILQTNPKRVIFNPGAENDELVALLTEKGIASENSCTKVLLTLGSY